MKKKKKKSLCFLSFCFEGFVLAPLLYIFFFLFFNIYYEWVVEIGVAWGCQLSLDVKVSPLYLNPLFVYKKKI